MSKSRPTASPADVRTWGAENGFTVPQRGRLNPDLVKAYNKANRSRPYKEGTFKPTVQASGVRVTESGRKVPVRRQVNVAEVRAAANAAGLNIGARGRVPARILSAYVVDETFATFKAESEPTEG